MAEFRARYSGKCAKRGCEIKRGDVLGGWSRTVIDGKKRGAFCLACKDLRWPDEARPSVVTPYHGANGNGPDIPDSPTDIFAALKPLADAMAPYLESKIAGMVDRNEVAEIVAEHIATLGVTRLEVRRPETGAVKTIANPHKKMARLVYYVGKRHHVYLWGPPGSGKSTAAQLAADALELPYRYVSLNPQSPASLLIGYMDATGTYRRTAFRDCYENGGVYCIDEMDNAAPALLTVLNSGLENGHMAFPDSLVSRHPDFVLIATGNTSGRGANPLYPERRPFDAASARRFVFVEWEYDEELERKIALAINPNAAPVVDWCQRARRWTIENGAVRLIISPGETFRLAEFARDAAAGATFGELLEEIVYKGIDAPTRARMESANPYPEMAAITC